MNYKAILPWNGHRISLYFSREPLSAAELTANSSTLILEDVQSEDISCHLIPDDVIESFREDLERELNEYDEYPHSAAEEAMFIDDLREREIYIQ